MMKRILITGADSYIGMSFESWINQEQFERQYLVDTIDVKEDSWRKKDFTNYDVIFHVAGIVHKKIKKDEKTIYDNVNHLLAIEIFKKALSSGVGQFIFMSSGAVFSQNDKNHRDINIMDNENYKPLTEYGKSKRRAEIDMLKISKSNNKEVSHLKLAIVRPPIIYGPNAKGNYPILSKVAKNILFFPEIENMRSMLYIDNLCECIRLIIDTEEQGFFHPQNIDYVCTSKLVSLIASYHGKKTISIKAFNPIINIFGKHINFVNKIFGNFIYDKSLSNHFDWKYNVVEFEKSIMLTENSH